MICMLRRVHPSTLEGADLPHHIGHVGKGDKVPLAQPLHRFLANVRNSKRNSFEICRHQLLQALVLNDLARLCRNAVVADGPPVLRKTVIPATQQRDVQFIAYGAEEGGKRVGRRLRRVRFKEPLATPLQGKRPRAVLGIARIDQP
jgi:hypothetical protein